MMFSWKGFRRKRSWPNCKVLFRHSPGGTEENHKKPEPESQIAGPRIEPGTFRIRSRSVNHSIATLGITDGVKYMLPSQTDRRTEPFKSSGNCVPAVITICNAVFCVYEFCMVLAEQPSFP
jgi:hypothetical protein